MYDIPNIANDLVFKEGVALKGAAVKSCHIDGSNTIEQLGDFPEVPLVVTTPAEVSLPPGKSVFTLNHTIRNRIPLNDPDMQYHAEVLVVAGTDTMDVITAEDVGKKFKVSALECSATSDVILRFVSGSVVGTNTYTMMLSARNLVETTANTSDVYADMLYFDGAGEVIITLIAVQDDDAGHITLVWGMTRASGCRILDADYVDTSYPTSTVLDPTHGGQTDSVLVVHTSTLYPAVKTLRAVPTPVSAMLNRLYDPSGASLPPAGYAYMSDGTGGFAFAEVPTISSVQTLVSNEVASSVPSVTQLQAMVTNAVETAASLVYETKTSSFTAGVGTYYDTYLVAPLTITLPAAPAPEVTIPFRISGASATNILTFDGNGENVDGLGPVGTVTGNGVITIKYVGTIGANSIGWVLDRGQLV